MKRSRGASSSKATPEDEDDHSEAEEEGDPSQAKDIEEGDPSQAEDIEEDDASQAEDEDDCCTPDDDDGQLLLYGMLCCHMFILLFLIHIYLLVAFNLIISSIIYDHQSIAGSFISHIKNFKMNYHLSNFRNFGSPIPALLKLFKVLLLPQESSLVDMRVSLGGVYCLV